MAIVIANLAGEIEYVNTALLRNNGDLTFSDVTERAGLAGPVHRTQSAAWADFDGTKKLEEIRRRLAGG